MSIRKKKDVTKDEKTWVFEVKYQTYDGITKQYTSKNYHTKKEAETAQSKFIKEKKKIERKESMNINELCNLFYSYQQSKVKKTTLYTYIQRRRYLKILENVKLNELTIEDYNLWRDNLDNSNLSINYKNYILKYLKELLKFAERWYGYDFRNLYNKFDKFRDPNAIIEENIDFNTYEEFKQFISVETNLKYKVAFELLYYCGLRRGELLGLTWNHINFDTKELSIKQNLVENRIEGGYLITSPKTRSSIRTIPLTSILIEHLKELKEENSKNDNFNNDWYVVGNEKYLPITTLLTRKNNNCKLSGLRQIRIHDFRHSCASLLISKSANVALVSKYLGHTKIDETLNTYTHFFKSDLDRIVEALNEL